MEKHCKFEKMRTKITILLAFAVLVATLGIVSAVPPLPYEPWGSVTIDGSPATDGRNVTAYINSIAYGISGSPGNPTTTSGGYYGLSIPGDDPDVGGKSGGEEGDTVIVMVDGNVASPTLIWTAGDSGRENLTVTVIPEFGLLVGIMTALAAITIFFMIRKK